VNDLKGNGASNKAIYYSSEVTPFPSCTISEIFCHYSNNLEKSFYDVQHV